MQYLKPIGAKEQGFIHFTRNFVWQLHRVKHFGESAISRIDLGQYTFFKAVVNLMCSEIPVSHLTLAL